MTKLTKALRKLAEKCIAEGHSVTGRTTGDIIDCIAEHFDVTGEKGDKGDTGETGAHVTAIELETTEGAITGGTATLSDGTTVEITVTEAPAGE